MISRDLKIHVNPPRTELDTTYIEVGRMTQNISDGIDFHLMYGTAMQSVRNFLFLMFCNLPPLAFRNYDEAQYLTPTHVYRGKLCYNSQYLVTGNIHSSVMR